MNTQEAIAIIRNGDCPACGPGKVTYDPDAKDDTLCICCGRIFAIVAENDLSIESVVPVAGEVYPYACAIEHPEHKWPIDYNNPHAEPLTEAEKLMQDGQEITPAAFECCDMFREMRDSKSLIYIEYDDDNNFAEGWYLSFRGNGYHINYGVRFCPACGASVP